MRTILSYTELFATIDTFDRLSADVSRFLALSPFSPRLDDLAEMAEEIESALEHGDSLSTDVEERAFLIRTAVELNNKYSYEMPGVEMYLNDELEIVFAVKEATYIGVMDAIRSESTAVVGGFVTLMTMVRTFLSSAGSALTRIKQTLA